MDAIGAMARRHHLHVIEDAAHALPASYRGRRIGTISELTAFSFYATKTITTGEGGMLVTDSDEYAARISTMRLHGISGDAWKRYSKEGSWYYEVMQAGYKHNLPDLLAAVGRAQLTKCDRFFQERRAIARCYFDNFSQMEELELPPQGRQDDDHAWHLFIVRIRPDMLELDRNAFIGELKHRGIGSSVHFIPLHLHPFYRQQYGYAPGDLPNAEDAYARCISLPIWPGMKRDQVERVVAAVGDIVARNRKPMAAVA
jgi:perosamine synthetase